VKFAFQIDALPNLMYKYKPTRTSKGFLMEERELHDGAADGLEALDPLDPEKVDSFASLLDAMRKTAFGGRRLGEAFDVLVAMIEDPDCCVVLTISGAMTIAKMGKIITSMIDHGMVQMIVSTGALVAHGLTEAIGKTHYKVNPAVSDAELFKKGYNRVYDTLEMEANLNYVESVVSQTLTRLGEQELSSELITRELGRTLAEQYKESGILKSAFSKGVPVYIPAFTDSELGLDVAIAAMRRSFEKSKPTSHGRDGDHAVLAALHRTVPRYNPFLDLNGYAQRCLGAKRLGILTVGGGVPRNWAQQIPPYVEISNVRLGLNVTPPRFQYGVRICPEPDYWGGLSGCTYSEGVSWGKFVPEAEGGRFAEVLSDATVVWPLLMMGLLERVKAKKECS
jgi:deoxyhypusine synthase